MNLAVLVVVGFTTISRFLPCTQGFAIHHSSPHHGSSFLTTTTRPRLSATVSEDGASGSDKNTPPSAELFDMEGWRAIQKDLDKVPIFAVATPEGNPLAYQVRINDNEYVVPFFYCDVADALDELEGAMTNSALEGLDIVPFPLGKAFELWCNDEAVIVPSKEALQQAGAPPGTNPVGQQVPMFACLEIMEENEDDGTGRLPLFMSWDDANAAVKEAVGADGGNTEDFDVVCLSLSGAIEQLATIPESPGFHFIPPSTSMKYIADYLS